MATFAATEVKPSLKDRIAQRMRKRVRAKRGPMIMPFELEYRHIYILPTKFGWGFGLMLIFMALGGLNFNNNMALMLVFLLATIAQLTTLIAHRNLSGLRVEGVVVEPVFCGESANFQIFVANQNERNRFTVQAGFWEAEDCKDFELNSRQAFHLEYPALKRGWLEMPSFRLETRFPLGMFRAWSWVFPQIRCLVYPAPAKSAPPLPNTGHGQSGPARKGEGEEIHGLREYKPGDSMHSIAWRTSARHDKLYSVEMEAPREQACELDWGLLAGHDTETRLGILTAWVLTADNRQLPYSLKLPGQDIGNGSGPHHRARCLEALALYRL